MFRIGKKMERQEVEYKFEGIDTNEGIDVYQLMPYLIEFGDLVQETVKELGFEEKVNVKVRPFKQGSFITEFVITYGNDLVSLFNSQPAVALGTAITVLGFGGKAVMSLPKAIKKLKGYTSKYKDNGNGTFEYHDNNGNAITVDNHVHSLLQSETIAKHYKNVCTGPIVGFNNTVTNIVIASPNETDESSKTSFSQDDIEYFDRYVKCASGEEEENLDNTEIIQHGIYLNPIAGSYTGSNRGYRFKSASSVVYNGVKIEDSELIAKLESSEIRFFEKDLLNVDLKITQTVSKGGDIKEHYAIVKLNSYIPYESKEQLTIDDFQ